MLSVQEKEPKREREQALIEMAEGDAVVREPSNWLVLSPDKGNALPEK